MRVLVAGIGNIFFGDDGFGPAVAQALAGDAFPGVHIEDYGIRGLHLAYELVSGYDRALLIDAVPRGGKPGTLYVLEPSAPAAGAIADAHRMDLESVFAFVRTIGGEAPPITLVGCEPDDIGESMDLSHAVRSAVPRAADLVRRLLNDMPAAKERGEKENYAWSEV